MVVMDVDHPDISEFIQCKADSEVMVAGAVTGSEVIRRHCQKLMDVVRSLSAEKRVSIESATAATA
jgi:hypothetical protein